MLPDCRLVRFWPGDNRSRATLVAYGRAVTLAAGDYIARFRMRAQPSGRPGILRINERSSQAILARAEITPLRDNSKTFFEQDLPFHLDMETRVEPQVLGEDSPLWLDRVILQPVSTPTTAARRP